MLAADAKFAENRFDATEGNMIKDRSRLTTENRNPASANIDSLETLSVVRVINAQDAKVAAAVGRVSREIAAAVDAMVAAVRG